MSVTDFRLNTTGLPVGTWVVDPVHSSAGFALKHHAVATFRGRFEKLDATLTVADDSAELAAVEGRGQADHRARARSAVTWNFVRQRGSLGG